MPCRIVSVAFGNSLTAASKAAMAHIRFSQSASSFSMQPFSFHFSTLKRQSVLGVRSGDIERNMNSISAEVNWPGELNANRRDLDWGHEQREETSPYPRGGA